MTPPDDLAVLRRAYAKRVLAAARVSNAGLERAFATTAREAFLGEGPWQIMRLGTGYAATPEADPLYLYDDVLVAIVPERALNNGQPSFHAVQIAAVDPRDGEHLVHVGAGTGYYTALMAQMVGARGKVTAVEFDPDLAVRARNNLAPWRQVEVFSGDGAAIPLAGADVIYVNAGTTGPAENWLDALNDGGRMILPLTAPLQGDPGMVIPRGWAGAMLKIERRGGEFLARGLGPVGIIPGEGLRDETTEKALTAAFQSGRWGDIKRLHRHADVADEDCWLRTPKWSLAYK